jgi:redox-sensitive bicupin YhaK (pirin superfamily)
MAGVGAGLSAAVRGGRVMTADIAVARRRIDRTHGVTRLGPDQQVDDKALVIAPTDVRLTDPFLALAEDWFSAPGFDWHPHRGIETVTLVLEGALEHGDNLGSAGVLGPGDVQWMTAGRGIIHRELAYRDEHAHTLQLWVNLPRRQKMVATRYQDVPEPAQPVATAPGSRTAVISGTAAAVTGPAANHWPITGLRVSIEPGSTVTHQLPAHDRAFLYVLAGEVSAAGRALRAGQVAWSDPAGPAGESSLELSAPDGDEVASLILFSGQPIKEPVAAGGPFVMNTAAEIQRAFQDFHAGRFGPIPRQARLSRR